jgi:hypothetical protein
MFFYFPAGAKKVCASFSWLAILYPFIFPLPFPPPPLIAQNLRADENGRVGVLFIALRPHPIHRKISSSWNSNLNVTH